MPTTITAKDKAASEMLAALNEMADERDEIAFTSNTRDLLTEADEIGLVKPVSGKFRCVEPGKLNSIYRLTAAARAAGIKGDI